jgi:hypothetical protein
MIFLAVLLFSTAASAQTQGYIGLFADVDHTVWCATPAAIPGNFNMWIYALPKADGTFCAEFKLEGPADPTLILASMTPNPGNSIILGDPLTGVSLCFVECQLGWTWIYQVLVVVLSANQNTISIAPHPTAGGPNFNECTGIRPVYPAVIFNNLYVNYTVGVDPECSETATAPASWGAIKSMFSE